MEFESNDTEIAVVEAPVALEVAAWDGVPVWSPERG